MDRDQAIERALRHALRVDPTRLFDACPDAETVAAWAARTLSRAEHEALEVHLADCGRCQALVAAFSRSEPEPAVPPSRWAAWRWPWLIPVATAATALAIWVATPDGPRTRIEQAAQRTVDSAPQEPSDISAPPAAPSSASEPTADLPRRIAPVEGDRPAPAAPEASGGALQARTAQQDAELPPAAAESRERKSELTETSRFATAADAVAPSVPGPSAAAAAANGAVSEQVATIAPAAAPAAPPPARQEALRSGARAIGPIDIVSPDPSVRWRITDTGGVERTTSGGATWTPVSIAPPAAIAAGASPDPRICWLVGRAGAVRLATDGVQFRAIAFPDAGDLVGVRATSPLSAIVTTADGRTFRTDDQGATWSVVPR